MDWFTGIIMFLLIWWVALFCVLPWGNTPSASPQTGNSTSAPSKPRIKLKFFVTTALSAVIWLIVYYIVEIELIDFHTAARQMRAQDLGNNGG